MSHFSNLPNIRWAANLIIGALIVAGLYFGRELIIPFVLAVFLSFLLAPVVRIVERLHMGRPMAVIVVALASFLFIGGIGWVIFSEASKLSTDMPVYRQNITAKVEKFRESIPDRVHWPWDSKRDVSNQPSNGDARRLDRPDSTPPEDIRANVAVGPVAPQTAGEREELDPVKVEVVNSGEDPLTIAVRLLNPLVHPLVTMGITCVILVFFLIYREDLRDRFLRICGRAHIPITTATITDGAARLSRYFAAQAFTNGLIGVTIGFGLYVIGVPQAPLWGLVATVFRFVPYIGTIAATLFPAALSAAISDGWVQPAMVVGWSVLVDILSANFLEPWLLGSRIGASPTAILASFLFWSWLWGGIGLFLATPITVCLITLGKREPTFEIFYVLLGNEPVLEPKLRFYQRLLSVDRRETLEIVKRFAENATPMEVFDSLLIPALSQFEEDRIAGFIEERHAAPARQIMSEIIEILQVQNSADTPPVIAGAQPGPALLLLPDRGLFDEHIPAILKQASAVDGERWEVVPATAFASEVVETVTSLKPAGVAILAIEPRSLDRILHICKRLNISHPGCKVHVGLFSTSARGQLQARRLRWLTNVRVSTTLVALAAGLAFVSRSTDDCSRPAAAA